MADLVHKVSIRKSQGFNVIGVNEFLGMDSDTRTNLLMEQKLQFIGHDGESLLVTRGLKSLRELRKNHPKFPNIYQVRHRLASGGDFVTSFTMGVSYGGVMFYSPVIYWEEGLLSLEISNVYGETDNVVKVRAQVIWTEPNAFIPHEKYFISTEFVFASKDEMGLVQNLIGERRAAKERRQGDKRRKGD